MQNSLFLLTEEMLDRLIAYDVCLSIPGISIVLMTLVSILEVLVTLNGIWDCV